MTTSGDFAAVIATAEALGQRFALTARHYDETGEFPFANFDALHEAGLLGLVTAVEHGGLGGGLTEALAVISAIARGEPSTALVLSMHYNQHYSLRVSGQWPKHLVERVTKANRDGVALINAAQVEPRVGSPSHGALPETIARRVGDAWRITGHKTYATGIPLLRWVSVLAVTDEPEPRLGSFLVPTDADGIRVEKTWNATGMRATNSDDLILDDVAIPLDDALDLAPAGEGLKRDERVGAWYFTLVPAIYDGAARGARDWLIDFATSRAPASLGAPLSTVPRIQDGIGQIEAWLTVNRRLLRSIAEDFDAGRPFGPDAAAVKHTVIENAVAATTLALELGGNPGINRDNPLERHHRDALSGRAHAPQNNLIRTMLAKAALGRHAAAPAVPIEPVPVRPRLQPRLAIVSR
ncbi:alkylation response protein AidB-like acyl-CoA dehydrogenase [Rhizobium sp. PP-F2F-G38]|uniref:Acyl-CoA/acyl-ACP dehydrogenase n=1 Tax=Ferranicluibacter rubi TaxID=2715133 RepID=A0AA43ZD33_9HYPH|nr:acyl-CoA dehydrogenase family protein [Ferranicluibacter rubi]NHT75580.1 acyl-CoA/acyl-ACP dehydrogenase [Ferranicluibacter rubi]PYE30914.1 alkylation response protein AidB-like acyl-CoA dehydrogenase [Rhizobium sp. PP-WC-1G-195]PYE94394.1 alkylation response protein AidB-like acyl-CoA dehydrogenase [Rhizobium sp. PP-F2F-G38]